MTIIFIVLLILIIAYSLIFVLRQVLKYGDCFYSNTAFCFKFVLVCLTLKIKFQNVDRKFLRK